MKSVKQSRRTVVFSLLTNFICFEFSSFFSWNRIEWHPSSSSPKPSPFDEFLFVLNFGNFSREIALNTNDLFSFDFQLYQWSYVTPMKTISSRTHLPRRSYSLSTCRSLSLATCQANATANEADWNLNCITWTKATLGNVALLDDLLHSTPHNIRAVILYFLLCTLALT